MNPLSRREFVCVGTGLGAIRPLSAEALGFRSRSTSHQETAASFSPVQASESEMLMANDLINSFTVPQAGWKKQANTQLLPDVIKPPFSFTYGSKESADLLPVWKWEHKTSEIPGIGVRHEITYTDPQTKVSVRVSATHFKNFPAVEWVIRFRNEGALETPILHDIQALDTLLVCNSGNPFIYYAQGARCTAADFMPLRDELNIKGEPWFTGSLDELYVEPGGGRSSSEFLPFFNVEAKGEGAVMAIGWTGEWAAQFTRPKDLGRYSPNNKSMRLRAGMTLTHLKLLPGEEIRTPLILKLFWQGDRLRGQNMLRRFILAHHRLERGGKAVRMPMCDANWGGTPAAMHIKNIKQILAHDLPMDYYWIDAGWYGSNQPWYQNTGNWQVRRDLYPDGFKPISDLLHASGRKFLLWLEPFRVCKGTPWHSEHAQWLLDIPKDKRIYSITSQADPRWAIEESRHTESMHDADDRLFNVGIPEAREFLTNFISQKIEEFGIDCYRQDFNFAPLEFWRSADAPDRQGMTEIRWVEGFYAFWDELLRRHPKLVIDVCASGGRQLDLETLSRALPLWRSDFNNTNTGKQCQTCGLLYWLPLNATDTGNLGDASNYDVRSSMNSGLTYELLSNDNHRQTRTDYQALPFGRIKAILERQRALEKYFYGDFYPLTEYTQAEDAWMGYQLDLPEENEGLVVILKRPASSYLRAVLPLKGLRKNALYEITNLESHQTRTFSADQLLNTGLEVFLANRPDSALIRYHGKGT